MSYARIASLRQRRGVKSGRFAAVTEAKSTTPNFRRERIEKENVGYMTETNDE